ncbi:aldehyde dehydrogenase family protein [Edaphobacter albus]|uniref:aldehyde dehydrogenase family protein n=1 Tax=Edaphobacter sp. 4G125 TaxID=2763071 RepID=UPI00164404B8|nr:aldehyde dehydrogenase family protein [Edaphobacter sp. 4G125]QNI37364.1 aldehyde dehydrogenase family protein [Edaphobacter sp. 4G125]
MLQSSTAASSSQVRTISPVDGSVYVERPWASEVEIEAALIKAKKAQREWKTIPVAERAAICRKAVALLVDRAEQLGTELTWQMGRPIRYSPMEIRNGFQERSQYMIDIAESELADLEVEPKDNFRRFIRKEPIGVVFAIMPWNYPYLCSGNLIIPAIMAGNSVILKPSPQTPLIAERYAESFEQAGLPKGVFQFLHLTNDQVERVICDPRVDFVAFTGSVTGGHSIQHARGERFIGTGLELGGKDPAYVRADAFLEQTIENLVDGVFFNSGQSCCAVERIYVHQDVWEKFVEGFVELTKKYVLGNPLDPATTLGPVINERAAASVRMKVEEAIHEGGARPLVDTSLFPGNKPGTPYLAPQVLVDVNHGMSIMTEETFGPVAPLMRVKDDHEAVALMNDSRYGLTASVWTSDADAALKIGHQIESGTWFMNRCDYVDPALPWTGIKDSGHGASLSRYGYASLTQPKSFHLRISL